MAPRWFVTMCSLALVAGCAALVSCDEKAGADVETVKIGSDWFHLELAIDNATRIKGLGGRDYIAPDGGMLFVFPTSNVGSFVMRDCSVPIDIAFLDGAGRVVAMHHMTVEPPRGEDESDLAYNNRLKQYPSRFPMVFAIETAGGRLGEVGLKVGDRVRFGARDLRKRAR